MAQILCPNCGKSSIAKTTKGTATSVAASFGGGIVEGVAKGLADGLLFEGAGSLVPKFGGNLASLVSVEHICNSCDCIFKATLYPSGEIKEIVLKKLPMPEEIIEKERNKYIQALRKQRPYVSTVILALLSLYCLIFMFKGIVDENGVQIVLSMIISIPFLIPTILKWKKISALNQQIEECEYQDLREFKHSHRDLFSQYKQYN